MSISLYSSMCALLSNFVAIVAQYSTDVTFTAGHIRYYLDTDESASNLTNDLRKVIASEMLPPETKAAIDLLVERGYTVVDPDDDVLMRKISLGDAWNMIKLLRAANALCGEAAVITWLENNDWVVDDSEYWN